MTTTTITSTKAFLKQHLFPSTLRLFNSVKKQHCLLQITNCIQFRHLESYYQALTTEVQHALKTNHKFIRITTQI